MALVDLISEDVVKVPLQSRDKPGVIRELVEVLVNAGKVKDSEDAIRAIYEREEKGSTGLEQGIAVPHAKTDSVSTLTLAIGISHDGIDFDSLDGKPSHLFFLMLASPNQSGPHIQALAEIAKMSRSRSFIEALIRARTSKEVVELFQD